MTHGGVLGSESGKPLLHYPWRLAWGAAEMEASASSLQLAFGAVSDMQEVELKQGRLRRNGHTPVCVCVSCVCFHTCHTSACVCQCAQMCTRSVCTVEFCAGDHVWRKPRDRHMHTCFCTQLGYGQCVVWVCVYVCTGDLCTTWVWRGSTLKEALFGNRDLVDILFLQLPLASQGITRSYFGCDSGPAHRMS